MHTDMLVDIYNSNSYLETNVYVTQFILDVKTHFCNSLFK